MLKKYAKHLHIINLCIIFVSSKKNKSLTDLKVCYFFDQNVYTENICI